MKKQILYLKAIFPLAVAVTLALPVAAQTKLEVDGGVSAMDTEEELPNLPEVEILHDSAELAEVLRPRPDIDYVNTVLAFNRAGKRTAVVTCVAYNDRGRPLGRVWFKVAGNGVGFVTASEISHGVDFVGSARCKSTAAVVPSAFIAGHGLTAARSKIEPSWQLNGIRFPVVVSF